MSPNRAMKLLKTFGGYQTFILRESTDTSLYNVQEAGSTRTCRYAFACVHTRSTSNLDPNIRLTFCDGDCISLLFHTLSFLRETDSLSTSRETYFLRYPNGGEIKGTTEIKEVDKIKGGQWREIAEVLASQHAPAVVCRARPSLVHHPSSILPLKVYQEKDSARDSNV